MKLTLSIYLLNRGLTEEDDEESVPYSLKAVTKPIISNEICRRVYREVFLQDITFCAGVPRGGRDACHGMEL